MIRAVFVFLLVVTLALEGDSSAEGRIIFSGDHVEDIAMFEKHVVLSAECKRTNFKECKLGLDSVQKFYADSMNKGISTKAEVIGLYSDKSEVIPLPLLFVISLMSRHEKLFIILESNGALYAVEVFSGGAYNKSLSDLKSATSELKINSWIQFSGKIKEIDGNIVYIQDVFDIFLRDHSSLFGKRIK